MTTEEARTELAYKVNDVGDTWSVDAVVEAVLSDVPLLMQAIGAVSERAVITTAFTNDVSTAPAVERWVSPWVEAACALDEFAATLREVSGE